MSTPINLDITARELATAFREAVADLRRHLAFLDMRTVPAAERQRQSEQMRAVLQATDRIAARGANLIDLATGAVVATPE
jgi:methylthioribose-1-phosphate isomerase